MYRWKRSGTIFTLILFSCIQNFTSSVRIIFRWAINFNQIFLTRWYSFEKVFEKKSFCSHKNPKSAFCNHTKFSLIILFKRAPNARIVTSHKVCRTIGLLYIFEFILPCSVVYVSWQMKTYLWERITSSLFYWIYFHTPQITTNIIYFNIVFLQQKKNEIR